VTAGILTLGLILGAASAALLLVISDQDVVQLGELRSEPRRLFEADNPLVVGEEVPTEAALATLSTGLPKGGSGRSELVEHVWIRGDGAVAFDYVDKMRIYFLPDDRNNESWAKEAVASDGRDLAGEIGLQLVDVGGITAVGLNQDETGPAAISWIQGGYMIEILGKGGQSLDQLTEVAKTFLSVSES
jgi:hypothetical protein